MTSNEGSVTGGQPINPPVANRLPAPYSPMRRAMDEVTAAVDEDGQPTGAYWRILGYYTARQTLAAESTRKMLVFFTVLAVLGIIAGLIIGIIGLNELSSAPDDPTGIYAP